MPSDASNRVGAGLGSAPFCVGDVGEKMLGLCPKSEKLA